jgi:hypothetical protein
MKPRTLPLILAATLVLNMMLAGGAVAGDELSDSDTPINISAHPGAISSSDLALLKGRGYQADDGFIRLPDQPPLTGQQLRDVLSALRAGPTRARSTRPADLRDALNSGVPAPVTAMTADQIRLAIVRAQTLWQKGSTGDEASSVAAEGGNLALSQAPSSRFAALQQPRLQDRQGTISIAALPLPPVSDQAKTKGLSSDAALSARPAPHGVRRSAAFTAADEKNPARLLVQAFQAAQQQGSLAARHNDMFGQNAGADQRFGSSLDQKVVPPPAPVPSAPTSRVASFYVSEALVNSIIKEFVNTPVLQGLSVRFVPGQGQEPGTISLSGLLKIPTEELQAIGIDKDLGDFRFQTSLQLKATRKGYLILLFPLDQTYFYPAASTHPDKDRVIVPVQLLSLALASARGYLSALSGDYSVFDRMTQDLRQQMAQLDHQIAATKDADAKTALQDDRTLLNLKLQAIPIQERQAQRMAAKLDKLLGFVGEKEINLNDELAAHDNAIVLRIKLDQITPYLKGIELGGVRILKDDKDGSGEDFLAIDINAQLGK